MEPERDELGRVCTSDGGVIPEDYRIEERDDDGDEDDDQPRLELRLTSIQGKGR